MRRILPIILCMAIICTIFASCAFDTVNIGNLTFGRDDSEIVLSGTFVKDISNVRKFTSLKKIIISDTSVTDLSPLKETEVEEIEITETETLSDLSPLKEIGSLKKVLIKNCTGILDFSVFGECENLEELRIIDSGLHNIEFVKKMPSLVRLEIKAKGVRDASPLKDLTELKALTLAGNKCFAELENISGLVNLEELKISDFEIEDISPVSFLVKLRKLDFSMNNIKDISPLKNLKEMRELNLAANDIEDISCLGMMTKLEKLYMEGCFLTNIDIVKNFKNLKELYISNNKVSSFKPLEKLSGLTCFFADNCGVGNITPLKNLNNLVHVQLANNKIKDISPLKGKVNIIQLGLSNNDFEDASVISQMKNIVTLDLSYCKNIKDVHFASELNEMRSLNLDGTQISDEDVEHLRSHLPGCNISFTKNESSDIFEEN